MEIAHLNSSLHAQIRNHLFALGGGALNDSLPHFIIDMGEVLPTELLYYEFAFNHLLTRQNKETWAKESR